MYKIIEVHFKQDERVKILVKEEGLLDGLNNVLSGAYCFEILDDLFADLVFGEHGGYC